jgi:tetratricopeptide (TPR) repeat protein
MRKLLLPLAFGGLTVAALSGCASNYPVERIESPVNVTHEVAFGEFRRVFNTAYHVVNRYGVVQTSSYRYGEIRALIGEDTSLFQKTRREIEARIVDAGDYWDVQCRVLIKVEDSEPATFDDQFNPLYEWRTVASDSRLEVRLNNEIRAALSGGAFEAKEHLDPTAREPYVPRKRAKRATKSRAKNSGWKKKKKERRAKKAAQESAAEESEGAGTRQPETDEVADREAPLAAGLPAAAFERIGVSRLGRGDYVQAARAFKAALETTDGDRRASFLIAQAELGQGRFEIAAGAVRRGLRTNPAWVKSDLDLRDLYESPAVLEGQFEKLSLAAARKPELNFLLGFERFHSADPEGALVAFERALKVDPEDTAARTYRNLARAQVDAAHGLEDF